MGPDVAEWQVGDVAINPVGGNGRRAAPAATANSSQCPADVAAPVPAGVDPLIAATNGLAGANRVILTAARLSHPDRASPGCGGRFEAGTDELESCRAVFLPGGRYLRRRHDEPPLGLGAGPKLDRE